MAHDDPLLRPYRPGDEASLLALYPRVFGKSVTEAHWRWKLRTRPCPVENVWVGEKDGAIVFQYAGLPARVRVGGRLVDALLSVDTMIDPGVQRRGLLTRLAPRVYSGWRDAGIAFVYGNPNERWGSALATLGLRRIFGLAWRVLPLRPANRLARRLGIPALARLPSLARLLGAAGRDGAISVREEADAPRGLDALAARAAYRCAVVRDAAWVRWRYLDAPGRGWRLLVARRGDEIAGYLPFRLGGREGRDAYVGEVFVDSGDEAAFAALLADLLARLAGRPDVENLFALAVPGQPSERWLRARGFFPLPGARWSVVLSPFDPALTSWDDADGWFYGGGDTDFV